eukprot:11887548-Alexandrium_andersonii.AAC.1
MQRVISARARRMDGHQASWQGWRGCLGVASVLGAEPNKFEYVVFGRLAWGTLGSALRRRCVGTLCEIWAPL